MVNRAGIALLLWGLLWIVPAGAQVGSQAALTFTLSIRDGGLTADIHRIPLRLVLEALARQAPLRLSVSEGARDHLVTAQFRALPWDEAMGRLLAGLSYAIFYDPAPSGAASAEHKPIIELVVLDKAPAAPVAGRNEAGAISSNPGEGPGPAPVMETTPEWTAALQHREPAARVEALERWAAQGAATPLDPLTHALVDPDESVRARAQALVERVWAARAEAGAR